MDGDESVSDASAPPENARRRVSVWLSGIVDEVRRKSPVRLQKWSESSEFNQSSDAQNNDQASKERSEVSKTIPSNSVLNELLEVDGGVSRSRKVWSAGSFLDRVRGIEGFHSKQEPSRLNVDSIKSIGRVKINEFYDKVRINKSRFSSLKSGGNMDKSGLSIVESDISGSHLDGDAEDVFSSTRNNFNNTNEDSCFDENLEITENDEVSFNSSQRIPLGGIGRSSTSVGYVTSAKNSIEANESKPPTKAATSANIQQKRLLGNIGRSFSEQTDDDNGSSSILNERSRSYSHVVSEQQAIPKCTSDIDESSVSSSLPTFFGRKSVPVSPVPQHKGAISREASLSDSPRRKSLLRDSSVQSDSSHCSSVESLLEARKPDPEAILINLGFGPLHNEDVLSRIPKRFMKPSQVKGIDIDTFLRQQQMASHLHDHSVLGYRGLLGNPDIPPSSIVAKIMERFEQNERSRCLMDMNFNRPQSAPPTPGPNQ